MPPGRLGKSKEDALAEKKRLERQKQLEAEREQNVKRLMQETKENALRKALLGDSQKRFDELLRKVQAVKMSSKDEAAWKKYLKCENLPDTNVPADVRGFLTQWRESLRKHWAEQISWWLKCDDRSVLTQDPFVHDERREKIQKQRVKTGKFYDEKLRELMKLYNSLSESLRRKKMTVSRYGDLLTIRDEVRETAFKFLDVLTLEVTMHVDREMISLSPWTVGYSLVSHDFVKYVWTYKDVPLPRDMKPQVIKMEHLNLTVTTANPRDLNSASIRGIWCKQDFLSDCCPTFYAPQETVFENLKSSLAYEQDKRKIMTEKHLAEMRAARAIWDEKMDKQKQADGKNKGAKKKPEAPKKPDPKAKKSKTDVEPPAVDEATYIDVEAEYCAFELEEFYEERKNLLPENLGLKSNEVNLREHQISNGMLHVQTFVRPSQTQEIDPKTFIRINENPKVLNVFEFNETFEPPKLDEKKPQTAQVLEELRKKALSKLIKVEIKLNEKMFWHETPTVCRWEPWEESDEFNELDEETKDFNLRYDEFVRAEEGKFFSARDPGHYKKVLQVEDFDLNSLDRSVSLVDLFKHYIVPMMPDEFKCFNEQMEIYEKKQREWQMISEAKKRNASDTELAALFEEIEMKIDINKITEEGFDKLYDDKMFHPRALFPKKHRNMIEILRGSECFDDLEIKSETLPLKAGKPDKNAPFLLSELVRQIETVKETLQPFFPETPELSAPPEVQKTKFKISHFIWKENRASRLSRQFKKQAINYRRSSTLSPIRPRSKGSKIAPSSPKSPSSLTVSGSPHEEEKPTTKPLPKLIPHHKGKWSTKHIYEESYDEATKTLTFYAGRLGAFGLATRKYVNLPFKSWEIHPVIESVARFVKLTVETQHITIEFTITDDGYTFQITNPRKVPFFEITNPIKIFELRKLLSSLNLNLFPEIDASCYVQDVSEKHRPMELHTYKSMAFYCLSHSFKSSVWNRFADRRVALFESKMIAKTDFDLIMVTPLKTASVNVRERCTPMDVVELDYEMIPPNQDFHPDLLDFLKEDVDMKEQRLNDQRFMTTWFVQALLMNIQPLSFS